MDIRKEVIFMANEVLSKMCKAVIDGDFQAVPIFTRQALDAGVSPQKIIDDGLSAGMSVIGQRFKAYEIFVPEVLIAAKAMQAGLEALEPVLTQSPVKPKGVVVIGTVYQDLHDIGKNLVGMLLRGAGIEVHDLGTNVPPEKFVEAVQELKPDMVGMSCLLTTTMSNMERTIKALREEGLRDKVKIIIGGQPITESYAKKIGADGYASDAGHAVDVVKGLLGIAKSSV